MNRNHFFPLLLTAVSVLSSCSKVDDMHDATLRMDAATAQMNQQTARLNQNTEHMKQDTERMEGVMTELFDSARQGAALDVRTKMWEQLVKSTTLEDKGLYSGLYFLGFEFQLWSNLGRDAGVGARERLMKDAVDEFFRHLLGIAHWAPEDVDPFAGKNPLRTGEVEDEKASFNALAGALERNNRKQEQTVAAGEELSMLSLIEKALLAGKDIREGRARLKDFPEYVDIVLSREELALRLLRARYQVMGLATLGYYTTMTRSTEEGLKYVLLGKKWELDFNELNESQVRVGNFRLGEARHARDVLAKLGVQVELDSKLKRVFSNVVVKNLPGTRGAHQANAQSETAVGQTQLVDQLKDYAGLE